MCQLLETIKCKDGVLYNIVSHEQRMCHSALKVFGVKKNFNLDQVLKDHKLPQSGLHKCRIIYDKKIDKIEIKPYRRRKVKDVVFVFDDKISYSYKFLDRTNLENYSNSFNKNTEVIFVKKNLLRDASYSNIVLYNGNDWHTPTYPLLKGTARSKLLKEGKIKSKKIYYTDLNQYTHICFINAMNDLEQRIYKL